MDSKFIEWTANDNSDQFPLTRHNSQLVHDAEKNPGVFEVEATQITDPGLKNNSYNVNHGGVWTNSTTSAEPMGRTIMTPISETIHVSKKSKRKHGRKCPENKQAKKCSVGCMPKKLGHHHKNEWYTIIWFIL